MDVSTLTYVISLINQIDALASELPDITSRRELRAKSEEIVKLSRELRLRILRNHEGEKK